MADGGATKSDGSGRHTRSSGLTSRENFCCFRSCKKSRGQHMVAVLRWLQGEHGDAEIRKGKSSGVVTYSEGDLHDGRESLR